MKLCGCVIWCKVGWLIVLVTLFVLPKFSYSQNLPPVPNAGVTDQHAVVGESFTYNFTNAFRIENGGSINYEITISPSSSWLGGSGTSVSGTPGAGDIGTHTVTVKASNSNDATKFSILNFSVTVHAAGETYAAFTMSAQSICKNQTINFINNSRGASSYNWTFGNGNTSNDISPSAQYSDPGIYTVILSINGGESVAQQTIYYYPAPEPVIGGLFTADCEPLNVGLQSTGSPVTENGLTGGAESYYYWSFPQHFPAQYTLSKTLNLNNLNNGLYDIVLRVTDANGCQGSKFENDLFEVYDTPLASFTYTKSDPCEPSSTTFTNTSTVQGNSVISSSDWRINGVLQTSHDNTLVYNFTTPGTYTVELVSKTNHGCSSQVFTDYVKFNSGNTANFTVNSQYCLGDIININAVTSAGVDSYRWDFDNNIGIDNDAVLNYTLNQTGNHEITLTVKFNDGCQQEVKRQINIEEVNADFDYNVTYHCGNTYDVEFNDNSSTVLNKTITSLKWFLVVGNIATPISTASNFSRYFNLPGNYTIRLVAETGDGCSANIEKTINLVQPTVTIQLSGATYGCLGSATNFSANYNSPYDVATTFTWNYGDGQSGTGASTAHEYLATGTYDVSVTVETSEGCFVSANLNDAVLLSSPPVISNFFAIEDSVCYSSPMELEAAFNYADTLIYEIFTESYIIGIPGGIGDHGFQYYPYNTGTYDVSLTAYNKGCASNTVSVTDLVALNPKANFSASQTAICVSPPYNVSFNNLSSYTSGKTVFSWDFGDGSPLSSEVSPTHLYESAEDFNVTLTVNDTENGCQDSYSVDIQIFSFNPPVSGVISTTDNKYQGCAPFTARFTQNISDYLSSNYQVSKYLWDFNSDGIIDDSTNSTNISHTYETPGRYTVTLWVTGNTGCSYHVTQNNLIQATGPDVKFTISEPACHNAPILFTNGTYHPAGEATTDSYTWDFGDGTTSNEISPAHTYALEDTFTVSLVATDANGCSASLVKENLISILPLSPNFNVSSTLVCSNDPVTFENTSTGNIAAFHWDFDNDGIIDQTTTDLSEVSYSYPTAGVYEPSLTAVLSNGCEKTISLSIQIINATVDFTAIETNIGCAPAFAYFETIATEGEVEKYNWDFGDGNYSNEASPQNYYSLPGYYTVSLQIDFKGGCSRDTVKTNFIFVDGAFGSFDYDNTPACSPNEVPFTISDMMKVKYLELDFGDGIVLFDTLAPNTKTFQTNYTYNDLGYTTPRIILSDDACPGSYIYSNSTKGAIYTSTAPVANFETDYQSICKGVPIHFTNKSDTTDFRYPAKNWNWIFGTSTNDSLNDINPVFAYKSQGVFSPKLIVSNELGCSDTLVKQDFINIYGNANLSSNFIIGDTLACAFDLVGFESLAVTSPQSTIEKYEWNFGDGSKDTGTNVSHAFNDTYKGQSVEVTHIVTDDKFCTDSTTRTVEIDNLQAAIGNVPQPVYRGSLVDFTDASTLTLGTNINNWSWNFENATPANSLVQNPQDIKFNNIFPNNSTSLIVTNNNGCKDTTTIKFDVLNNPPTAVSFDVSVIVSSEYIFKGTNFDNDVNPIKDHFYPNDPPEFGQSLTKIRIVSLPDGSLKLNNSFISVGNEIEYNQIGSLLFTPNQVGWTSFDWEGFDGFDWSNTASVNIDVKAEPGPPVLEDILFTLPKDSVITIRLDDFLSKITSDQGNDMIFDSLRISASNNPSAGQLYFNNIAIAGDILIRGFEINNTDSVLEFRPTKAFSGDVSFTWNAYDGFKSAVTPANIAITYANAAPILTDIIRIDLAQGSTQVFANTEFKSNYSDEDKLDVPVTFKLNELPSAATQGTFYIRNTPITGNLFEVPFNNLQEIRFVPIPSFEGEVTANWQISDGYEFGTAQIILRYINAAPIVHSFTLNGAEDAVYQFKPFDFESESEYPFEDIDPTDKVEAVQINGLPLHGTLKFNGNIVSEGFTINRSEINQLSYQTIFDWNGIDTIVYKASDGTDWAVNDSFIFINAAPVNDPPRPEPDFYTINEDDLLTGVNVGVNDIDVDDIHSVLKYRIEPGDSASAGEFGTITLLPNGDLTFMPHKDVDKTLYFVYTVCDDDNYCAKDTVTIYINPINDPPTAVADVFDIFENDSLSNLNCLTNDSDIDGNTIELKTVRSNDVKTIETPYGKLVWETDGSLIFTVNAGLDTLQVGEKASVSFEYVINDVPAGLTDTSIFTINIWGVNNPPVTANIVYNTQEGIDYISTNSNYQSFLSNDFDPENDPFEVHEVNGSASNTIYSEYGTFIWRKDGEWEFYQNTTITNSLKQGEPLDLDYYYTTIDKGLGISNESKITFRIEGVNDDPIALNDTLYIFESDLSVYIAATDNEALLTNDTDIDGDNFKVTLVETDKFGAINSSVGLLKWSKDGSFTYIPKQDSVNQLGATDTISDVFNYTITDDFNGTASAQLFIFIIGENDAPLATDDELSIFEDTHITFVDSINGLLANDIDFDHDPIVVDVNDLGTHLLQGEYGTLSWESNGAYTYVTNTALVDTLYYGEQVIDIFTYRVTDNVLTSKANLFITIIGENDAPVAKNHFEYMTEDEESLTVKTREKGILAEDFDIDDHEDFGIVLVNEQKLTTTSGKYGSLNWNYDGTFVYNLNPEIDSISATESVIDSFLYIIEDPYDSTAWAYFIIEIKGLNDNPEAQIDHLIISEDTLIYFAEVSLLENDKDTDGDLIEQNSFNNELISPINTTYASFKWDSTGFYTYLRHVIGNKTLGLDTLAFDDVVFDTIPYSIIDNYNYTSESYLAIQIHGENDPPVAINDNNFISENTPSITSSPNKYLLINDYEIDRRDSFKLLNINGSTNYKSQTKYGSIIWDNNGSYTYTLNFDATDSLAYQEKVIDYIPYTIIDKQGAKTSANLEITIIGTNDKPVAVNDTVDISEDEKYISILEDKIGVMTNDYDVDGDSIYIETPNNEAIDSLTGMYGTLIIHTNGHAEYILNAEMDSLTAIEKVVDIFEYKIIDTYKGTSTAKIIIRIKGLNDIPLAIDDFVSIDEDTESIIAPVNTTNALLYNDIDSDGDSLNVISVNDSSLFIINGNYGELQWNSNGSYTYITDKLRSDRLAEGDTVNELFTYSISDTYEGKDTAVLNIEIIGVNDPPVALFDSYKTFDIEPIIVLTTDTFDILDNDYDVDGISNHITLVKQSVKDTVYGEWGMLKWSSNGSFTFQPDSAKAVALRPDQFKTDVFEYTIEDDHGASDTSTININLWGINNAPKAYNDSIFIDEDELTGTPLESIVFNDTDPDLDTLLVTHIEGETNTLVKGFYGTVSWTTLGNVVFTSNRKIMDQIGPNQIKNESYTYTIVDEGGLTSSADIVIVINGKNDPIVAFDDYVTVLEDSSKLVDVLENDIDPDNNFEGNLAKTPVHIKIQPLHGKASVNSANGNIFYKPNKNYSGADSLLYEVCDDQNSCSTAWVYFDITPINDPPVASHVTLITPLNTPISFNGFEKVVDLDDGINPASLKLPSYHNIKQNGDSLIYIPPADSAGLVEFIYSLADYENQRAYVIVTVLIQDDGFGAQNDTISTYENTSVNIKILANDTLNSFEAEPLSLNIQTSPLNGIASYSPFDHYITYLPFDDFNGIDSLTYIVGSSSGKWDFAKVYIYVEPINSPIIASDDDVTTIKDQQVYIAILNNDYDSDNGIDSSSVKIRSYPKSGTVSYNPLSGLISYVPNTGFKGYDTFTYEVCDLDKLQTSCGIASVYIRVKSKFDDLEAKNDVVNTLENKPVEFDYEFLIQNDVVSDGEIDPESFTIITKPQHGEYTFDKTTNTIVYKPTDNYFGFDWMTYQVCDNDTSCDMAQINIWIQEVNTPPIANNDQFVVTNNTKKRLHILTNDYDVDGTLNWSTIDTIAGKGPRKGTIEFDRNTGTILYLPDINSDIDKFTYTICDDEGLCSEAVVTVSVDLGSTILYNQITYEDTPDTFDIAPLLANYNFFFNVVKYSEVIGSEIGSWKIINNNTQIVYTPNHDSIGYDYYNITLYSGGKDTVDLKVTVTILPVNDSPVAINDTVTWNDVTKEITFSWNHILKNDFDVDGDVIILTKNVIDHGDSLHVTFNSDSTITVYADTIFWCNAWFSYEIKDPMGEKAIGIVNIFPVLDGITAIKDEISVTENTYIDIDVLINDIFKDQQRCTIDTLKISQLNPPINGNAYTTEQNTITYTPKFHYYGLDSFIYIVRDIWGQTDSTWVIIDVIQKNTPPIATDDEAMNDFGSELIIAILDNDYDPDSDGYIDTLRTFIKDYPLNGNAWFNADSGIFVYTPMELTCENDQFSYTIIDNEGDSASATVYISLPNEAPLFAVTDTVKTWPGVPMEFNVLTNDRGYFIPYIENFSNPYSGYIEQTGDSTFIFYPNADFMGNDSMTYQLVSPCDNQTMGYVLFMIEELRVPEIISPNDDGKNDVLIIDGIQYFPDALLQIFNRYGHVVYQTKAYQNNWGGYSNQGSFGGNKPLPSGTYFYTLTYNEGKNKQAGSIYIFR